MLRLSLSIVHRLRLEQFPNQPSVQTLIFRASSLVRQYERLNGAATSFHGCWADQSKTVFLVSINRIYIISLYVTSYLQNNTPVLIEICELRQIAGERRSLFRSADVRCEAGNAWQSPNKVCMGGYFQLGIERKLRLLRLSIASLCDM